MDDLAFLHERIESYADYTNHRGCLLADEQIRAYVGVAVARVSERLGLAGATGLAAERVLLRCQFVDQRLVRAFDANIEPLELAAIHAVDRDLITLGDRADSIDAASAAAYIAEVDAVLDRRTDILLHAAAPIPPAPPPR